jgi:hypothetical protein
MDGSKPIPRRQQGLRRGLRREIGEVVGGGELGPGGRMPNAWKDFCRRCLEDPKVQLQILARARQGEPAIIKLLADSSEGAPDQRITVADATGALDRLLARLAPSASVLTTTGVFPPTITTTAGGNGYPRAE